MVKNIRGSCQKEIITCSNTKLCVCVCVCARACVCMHACVRVYVCVNRCVLLQLTSVYHFWESSSCSSVSVIIPKFSRAMLSPGRSLISLEHSRFSLYNFFASSRLPMSLRQFPMLHMALASDTLSPSCRAISSLWTTDMYIWQRECYWNMSKH